MTAVRQVRRVNRREMEDLVALYRRAFWDDPVIVHLLPNEKTRARPLDAYMRMVLRYGLRWGRVQAVEHEGRLRVGAVWLPPGGAPASTLKQMRSGFFAVVLANLNWRSLRIFLSLANELEKLHRHDVDSQHWYLWLLAVDPPDQGQGYGSTVLAPELREADTGNAPCYVETAKRINLEFYQKQGFVMKREVQVPGDGPPLWTLVREPVR